MAQKILNTKIREAYDTEANWVKYNPILLAGQLAFSSDKYGRYKIGNGNSKWSELPYNTLSWTDIAGKPSTFTPSTHNHTISQITDIGSASVKYATTSGTANAVAWSGVSGKPATFPPSSHTHTSSQITGLPTKLPNPYALTVKGNGYLINTYDGSGAKEINITPSSIGAANSSHTHLPSQIVKGTYNVAGAVSTVNRNLFNRTRACKTAFMPAESITVEYTGNNGSTWSNYELDDINKMRLFSLTNDASLTIGKGAPKVGNGTRITIKAIDRYVSFDIFYCWYTSQAHTCTVTLERSTAASPNTFQTIAENIPIDGWSGVNEISFPYGVFGGSPGQTSNFKTYRITFKITKVYEGYKNFPPLVSDLRFYGDNCWTNTNPMMLFDSLYSWDALQNAVFPANITAKSFIGNLQGAANSANVLNANAGSSTQPVYFTGGKPVACTYTLGKSVPSNAVFTDTNTWRPIQDNLTSTSTTDSLSANQGRILKGLVDGKAPSSHTHNTINDFSSGKALSISNSIHTTPETAGDYDIVVTNTNNYGNKLITMTKVSLINQISDQVISNIPLKAITNSQIDSLANL